VLCAGSTGDHRGGGVADAATGMIADVTEPTEPTEPTEIVIGDLDGEHVRIRVLGRTHAAPPEAAGSDWLVSPITIVVGGFTGQVPAALRSDELHRFREGLQEVQRTGGGTAVLKSIEDWISLAVVLQTNGTLSVTGSADDEPGIGNTLRFAFDGLPSEQLGPLVAALRECEDRFGSVPGP